MSFYIGTHWIFDGMGAQAAKLDDEEHLRHVLRSMPDTLGLTRVNEPQSFRHDGPEQRTLAGVVLLAESHFSVHTFPDQGVLHCDMFSCKTFDLEVARKHIVEAYAVADFREQVFTRTGAARGVPLNRASR